MKVLGKVLLWLLALAILGVLCWGLALYLEWPLWFAVALFAGCIGLYLLIKFLRRLYIVLRSRSKLAQLGAPLQTAAQATSASALARKWKAAVATLRKSSLKRLGDPLYVLPWYIVIGRSGTGKTTALTRARLTSPIQKVDQSAAIGQTANVDWWYFDQAVVIDSAGRYVDAQDLEQDRREWELSLDLLARYRPREGVDGLVLAIAADRLATADADALIEEGRVIRTRIEQLIQMFGKRFPIYVLVTKCDQIYGLEAWARELPGNALEQAMGFLSDEVYADAVSGKGGEIAFLDRAFGSIDARLQKLRIAMIARSAAVAPELLLFPNELERLRPRLEVFIHACLADNPYLERPFLRGLFLSSGQQEGGAISAVLDSTLPPVAPHPSARAGLFLHDFFGRVLPQDRHSSRPAELVNHWRRVTQYFGVTAWWLITAALGILLTLAFVDNIDTLKLLRASHPYESVLTGKLDQDVLTLTKERDVLVEVMHRDAGWMAQWMVFTTHIDGLEKRLKQHYVEKYRDSVLPAVLHNQKEDLDRLQASDPDDEEPFLLRNLVRSINLDIARQHGAGLDALQAMPQRQRIGRYTAAFYQKLNQLFLAHLAWSDTNDPFLATRVHANQMLLDREAYANPQMTWVIGLVPDKGGPVSPVYASDFWNTRALGAAQAPMPMVPAAYTRAGRQTIDAFLGEMDKSVGDHARFMRFRSAFDAWYREQRILAWQNFITNFAPTERLLAGEPDWRTTLSNITGGRSPYYRVLDRLNKEFADEPAADLPDWIMLARDFERLRKQALLDSSKAAKVVGAIDSVGGQAIKDTLGISTQAGSQDLSNNLAAAEALGQFFNQVNQIATEATGGSGKAYQIASDFHRYSVDPAVKTSSVYTALGSLAKVRQFVGHTETADEPVWNLIGGPLHFALSYVEQQASCEVQKDWQAKVLFPLQTVPDQAAQLNQLYGDKGTVWAFADGIAKPFIERDGTSFHVVQTLGYSVPFTGDFLPTLNNAVNQRVGQLVDQKREEAKKQAAKLQAEQQQLLAQQAKTKLDQTLAGIKPQTDQLKAQVVQVTVSGQPTGVNSGALSKPYATALTVQCAASAQRLENYNFPVSVSFPWSAGQCGEVSLQIKIDSLVLTKRYPGPLGLAHFFQDFHNGAHRFDASDFPEAKSKLQALKVTQLSVHYNFEGQDSVITIGQNLESLDQLQQATQDAQQQLQDADFKRAQQAIQDKITAVQMPSSPSINVALPQQIGVCWEQQAQSNTSDVSATIRELVTRSVTLPRAPASAAKPGSAPRAPHQAAAPAQH